MTKPLEKIDVDKVQRQIIGDFAGIIAKETNTSEMVIKGFLWKALRSWQKKHGMTHSDTEKESSISPTERIQQTIQIFEIFKPKIFESMEIDDKALKSGIKKSLNHYEQQYANR